MIHICVFLGSNRMVLPLGFYMQIFIYLQYSFYCCKLRLYWNIDCLIWKLKVNFYRFLLDHLASWKFSFISKMICIDDRATSPYSLLQFYSALSKKWMDAYLLSMYFYYFFCWFGIEPCSWVLFKLYFWPIF